MSLDNEYYFGLKEGAAGRSEDLVPETIYCSFLAIGKTAIDAGFCECFEA